MDVVWDGIRRAETLGEEARLRHTLADAARSYDWPRVLELISGDRNLVNVSRPDGASLYAPLHQAAHGGAPVEVARRLIDMGAWRTLQNARGERPVDVADRLGHRHLLGILAPVCRHAVPTGVLLKIQAHFDEVIRGRIDETLPGHGLRLPELEPLLELDRPQMWFPVPGMYGGFSYRLESTGAGARLISESWCRVAAGSGQRHLITSAGSELVAEGFV
ncbi:ankyrin repeat domain-containing protein [Marinimicrococcus flavescens]|uniref:Ankyrin repeat domain-containing protein n=1 Tax=Marinimicrococcus flavescens TaxID=3031815 RepID=A0AAP3XQX3_9PROT|nr:ankyrin repeat domain-containing protein [Marinimicrococcus flavescens]